MCDLNKVCMAQPRAESPVRNFLKRRGYLDVCQKHLDQMLPLVSNVHVVFTCRL
jgi:hypothetical protein